MAQYNKTKKQMIGKIVTHTGVKLGTYQNDSYLACNNYHVPNTSRKKLVRVPPVKGTNQSCIPHNF